ncbi:MAG: hypothetical protein WB608_13685 [Terracidiphilus sp.]
MKCMRSLAIAASTLVLALLALPHVQAQCGNVPASLVHPGSFHPQFGNAHLENAALLSGLPEGEEAQSIVGMWHVTFTANTLNGSPIPDTVIDNALVVWHSDGTEIMNSARPPQDGNFCMGVWEQTGKSKYKLNHFAWAGNEYAPGTADGVVGVPAGPTHITESVTLSSDGNHFAGAFTLDAYHTDNTVTSFTGVVTATRITMTTTVNDLM